jgi:hypothetical protein
VQELGKEGDEEAVSDSGFQGSNPAGLGGPLGVGFIQVLGASSNGSAELGSSMASEKRI